MAQINRNLYYCVHLNTLITLAYYNFKFKLIGYRYYISPPLKEILFLKFTHQNLGKAEDTCIVSPL